MGKAFTVLYNGKAVACTREGDTYLIHISYVPLYLERIQNSGDAVRWIDKEQHRETDLSKELGALIENGGLA